METKISQIQFRQDTETNWATANPVLAMGEPGFVTDGQNANKFKIGDGTSTWTQLAYQTSVSSTLGESPADGKLYGRRRLASQTTGAWEEVVVPAIDTRKNLNDILSLEYGQELDMGYAIVTPQASITKELYAKRFYNEITAEANTPVTTTLLTGVYSIIGFGGSMGTQENVVSMLPNADAVVSLNTSTNVVTITTTTTSARASSPLDLWIMYTKE